MEFEKVWQVRWRNHWIVVRSWWNHRLQCGEQILVDDRVLDEEKGSGRTNFRELGGEVRTGGSVYSVRARLGETKKGRLVCQIFENEELVGGDVGEGIVSTLMPIASINKYVITSLIIAVVVLPPFTPVMIYEVADFAEYQYMTAYKYVLGPCIVGVYLWGRRYATSAWRSARMISQILGSVLLGGVLALFAAGHLLAGLLYVGPRQTVEISGEVLEKRIDGKYWKFYDVVIKRPSGNPITLTLTKQHFIAIRPGDQYRETWYRGPLGMLYR